MAGRFLRSAYEVLDKERRPLEAHDIVRRAEELGLLRTHGRTPANTMRARLSDDIRQQGALSQFQRVGPNRFGLREWNLGEYHSRPFQKELPSEITVCVPSNVGPALSGGRTGFFEEPRGLDSLLRGRERIVFVDRRLAEATTEYKQLISYAWLETEDGLVLSYVRGKYSSAHRTLLLGKKSVGFGGHVLQQDAESLFASNDAGVEQAALREIGEELLGQQPQTLKRVGVIWDDTSFEGHKHLGIVMKGRLPNSRELSKLAGEFAINRLELLSKVDLWANYHAMEFWSQLLMREFAQDARPSEISVVVPGRRPSRVDKLVLVGEIASGKTSIARSLADDLGYSVISASDVLRRLLKVHQLSEKDRSGFQEVALRFIRTEGGPDALAGAIADAIAKAGTNKVIVDGLRQLATLEALRKRLPDAIVLFIDCPRDVAFQNYMSRLDEVNVNKFAEVREHEVEAELPLFRFEADAIVHNADRLSVTTTVLKRWLSGK